MTKSLVTSAAGFIGQHLVRALSLSCPVVAIDNIHQACRRGIGLAYNGVAFIGVTLRDRLAAKANVMPTANDPDLDVQRPAPVVIRAVAEDLSRFATV